MNEISDYLQEKDFLPGFMHFLPILVSVGFVKIFKLGGNENENEPK